MGNVTVKSYRKEREAEIMAGLNTAMERVAKLVEKQAQTNVNQSPPSHPQVQTGRLYSSIDDFSHVERDGNEITAVIGTNVYYGFYLEFGTVKMPAYPWLFPAVELKRQEIVDTIKAGGGRVLGIEEVAGIWNE